MSDPVPLAREVLETAYEDETVTVCSVPDNKVATLARAVIAAVELAEELREVAHESYQVDMGDAGDAYQAAADLIHAALNGETE